MCSVFDFIDKQKYILRSQRKTIQTLYEFLDSIDKPNEEKTESNDVKKQIDFKPQFNGSKEESNRNHISQQKIGDKNNLMIGTNGLLGWIGSKKSEQRRRQLAEERRREYNEFLQQKSNYDSQNTKRSSKRVMKLLPDYNDILNTKRIEERKHRQSNGLDMADMDSPDSTYQDEYRKTYPELPQIGWSHCSNNKFVNGYIIPRSRLLATHSSRLKAAKYREELRKQVEEKERIKAEERQQIRLEDEELERKLDTQRLKMFKEFEEEHRPKQHTKQMTSDEDYNQLLNRDLIGSTSPLSVIRSPTYTMHMKGNNPLNRSPRKSSSVSRSLLSALSQTNRNTQSMATQTSDEQKYYPVVTSEESSECESSIFSGDEEEEDRSKEAEFRRRVLSQLSEVRQMMESDHIKMMEQLREQQLDK